MSQPTRPLLLVIDAANVVGSVPDGWWRDRFGATERLRDGLAAIASEGLPAHGLAPPVEVVLVVEGKARGVLSVPGVRVVDAQGEGDDTIVEVVRDEGESRTCVVATADRALSERVAAHGARVIGPRSVRGSTNAAGRPRARGR